MWKIAEKKLFPDLMVERISDISPQLLSEWKLKGVILDVDNTLLSKKANAPDDDILTWVKSLKSTLSVVLLSNNIPSRIQRASIPLDLPYIAWTMKPIPWYFKKALRFLKLQPHEVCMIGDQLFTDILGAKWVGAKTIYVRPMDLQNEAYWTKCMRKLEKRVMRRWKNTNNL